MQTAADRQEAFRERQRREGLRNMVVWLDEREIAAVDRVKSSLGLTSRSDALRHILGGLAVTSNAQPKLLPGN